MVTVKAHCANTLILKLSEDMKNFKTDKKYEISGDVMEMALEKGEIIEIVF